MSESTHQPHGHAFGQDVRREGERRTLIVVGVTAVMMVAEIAAGLAFGSMALLADGLHMGSHATALTVSVIAYVVARRHAHDRRFSWGTGKVNALGGYTGACLLLMFAGLMAWESVNRLVAPQPIVFAWALAVAALGLIVNGASLLILHAPGPKGDGHAHAEDHALHSAFLHVLADTLTSALAIVALLAGWLGGWVWLDPAIGIVGAVLIVRWTVQLARDTGRMLLDWEAPAAVREMIRQALEGDGRTRVFDLHVWSIGPGLRAAAMSIVAAEPLTPEAYKARIPPAAGIHHATIEVHRAGEHADQYGRHD